MTFILEIIFFFGTVSVSEWKILKPGVRDNPLGNYREIGATNREVTLAEIGALR